MNTCKELCIFVQITHVENKSKSGKKKLYNSTIKKNVFAADAV